MKLSLSFWLALIAMILALSAMALRFANRKLDDYGDIIGPIAIGMLMLGILMREWRSARQGRSDG